MKHFLLLLSILILNACGGGGGGSSPSETNDLSNDTEQFTLQNIRFDAKDYYEGEQVSITENTSFEVQWVSPTSASYKIDLYLSSNGEKHSQRNQIVALKCGGASFSLCPNATGDVQCIIEDSNLSCSIDGDYIGNMGFQDSSNLEFIIQGCDALSHCDVKTFHFLLQNNTDD